jgi:hypothetical protein
MKKRFEAPVLVSQATLGQLTLGDTACPISVVCG